MMSFDDQVKVTAAIRKLFISQGRTLNDHKNDEFGLRDKEMLQFFIDRLREMNAPTQAIVAGLKSLESEPLREIKLSTIKDAIRNKLTPESGNDGEVCPCCKNTGSVLFESDDGHGVTFGCTCPKKLSWLKAWDGEPSVTWHDRVYHRHETTWL